METMSPTLGWDGIALRLGLALVAGALVGLNRGEHARPAGLRTTMLTCLAAAIAMIQVNLLLPMAGKAADSFVTNDLMRLPLGILTGVGFIGGGAILRKGDVVRGVTTAATLWMVTVLGLCFGGGQVLLGVVGTGLALFVLWILKRIEDWLPQQHQAHLGLVLAASEPAIATIRERLQADGFETRIDALDMDEAGRRHVQLVLHWRAKASDPAPPPCLDIFAAEAGVVSIGWARRAAPPA